MFRFFHSTPRLWGSFDKSLLAKLRKKTGYTFSNCKKALEVCDNDIEKAEKWLQEQARALGWAKATKLEGRATAQGLIAIALDASRTSATIVEVNCETDFVARNKYFASLVNQVTSSCLQYSNTLPESGGTITKAHLNTEQLRGLTSKSGESLSDLVALSVGSLGENLSLRRASCLRTWAPHLHLAGYTHPAPERPDDVLLGKYGALVAFTDTRSEQEVQLMGRQLCQHIVGMCPQSIGDLDNDEPCANKDDETRLVHQEFLADPTISVGHALAVASVNVEDFIRFECGENTTPKS